MFKEGVLAEKISSVESVLSNEFQADSRAPRGWGGNGTSGLNQADRDRKMVEVDAEIRATNEELRKVAKSSAGNLYVAAVDEPLRAGLEQKLSELQEMQQSGIKGTKNALENVSIVRGG